mmetsp:Transcript_97349/g.280891  ORF Transcript_97349/g.280891 Transcript_97349/m.280891 type:complete len:326 (-) Transcript_97349:258-1235(-)
MRLGSGPALPLALLHLRLLPPWRHGLRLFRGPDNLPRSDGAERHPGQRCQPRRRMRCHRPAGRGRLRDDRAPLQRRGGVPVADRVVRRLHGRHLIVDARHQRFAGHRDEDWQPGQAGLNAVCAARLLVALAHVVAVSWAAEHSSARPRHVHHLRGARAEHVAGRGRQVRFALLFYRCADVTRDGGHAGQVRQRPQRRHRIRVHGGRLARRADWLLGLLSRVCRDRRCRERFDQRLGGQGRRRHGAGLVSRELRVHAANDGHELGHAGDAAARRAVRRRVPGCGRNPRGRLRGDWRPLLAMVLVRGAGDPAGTDLRRRPRVEPKEL